MYAMSLVLLVPTDNYTSCGVTRELMHPFNIKIQADLLLLIVMPESHERYIVLEYRHKIPRREAGDTSKSLACKIAPTFCAIFFNYHLPAQLTKGKKISR